jgi:transcriptional regulator with PAS, ATPase and Fis domain
MKNASWLKEFPAAISICDSQGILLDMNEAAEKVFAEDGGRELIGSSILECHPEPARSKLEHMLRNQEINTYTIEKDGGKKLIYQAPWYTDGKFSGFVEISLVIPTNLQHFNRK